MRRSRNKKVEKKSALRRDLSRIGIGIWSGGAEGSNLIAAGCTGNQIHLLISLSKNDLLTQVMCDLKSRTSKWMKGKDTSLRSFQWQEGYGAFSIGASQVPALRSYLERQKEHHRKRTFEDEFVALLEKYGMEFDAEYLWL